MTPSSLDDNDDYSIRFFLLLLLFWFGSWSWTLTPIITMISIFSRKTISQYSNMIIFRTKQLFLLLLLFRWTNSIIVIIQIIWSWPWRVLSGHISSTEMTINQVKKNRRQSMNENSFFNESKKTKRKILFR